MLKETILERLGEDERVRKGSYRVTVRVWLAQDGRVERAQLADSTGNRDVDAAIEQSLERLGPLREGPPLEMPQPITLRIVSRG
jgi:protein TonB